MKKKDLQCTVEKTFSLIRFNKTGYSKLLELAT